MSHFESMQLEKQNNNKKNQMEGQLVSFGALLKKGLMMNEHVFIREATLYSATVSLLLTHHLNTEKAK